MAPPPKTRTIPQGAIFFAIAIAGLAGLGLGWRSVISERAASASTLAGTAAAAFSRPDLASLSGTEADLLSPAYDRIKSGLVRIVGMEKKAKFAYFMMLRDNKVIFVADSESPTSPDYSPPGQVYGEADSVLLKAFESEAPVVTPPSKDHWGEWVSILVPIKSWELKHPVVFGFDYYADRWRGEAYLRFAGIFGLVSCFYLLAIALFLLFRQNSRLRGEKAVLTEAKAGLKAARDAEHRNGERVRLLLDSTGEAIYGTDPDGRLSFCNTSFLRLLGYNDEREVLGRDAHELIHKGGKDGPPPEKGNCRLCGALKGKELIRADDGFFRRADGSVFPVEYFSFPQLLDGALIGVVVSFHDIAGRLERERQERRTSALLRAMMECHPDVVIFALDDRYRYLAFNDNHRKTMKAVWEKDIEVGTNMLDEVIGSTTDREHYRSSFDRALAGESLVLLEEHGNSTLARSFWQDFYAPILGDDGRVIGLTCLSLNMDAQKLLETRLAEDERLLTEAQRVARLGYYVVDTATGVWRSSPLLDEILGIDASYKRDTQGWEALITPRTRGFALAYNKKLSESNGCRAEFEYEITRPLDGQHRWLLDVSEAPSTAKGLFTTRIGTVLDITERKVAEGQIRALNADLEKRVDKRTAELMQANKELEAFSYSVSHDLRAPLRAIDGFAQILEEESGYLRGDAGKQMLAMIRSNVDKMKNLIDCLLDLSRLGRNALRLQPLDMGAMVTGLLSVDFAGELSRDFIVTVHDLPKAQGDPVLVKQIWFNLISNALKYSARSETKLIEIGGEEQENGFVEYYVKDKGVGFDQAYAGRLFAPFQRLHSESEFEGTGMGLAIVQRIVSRHGGLVCAEGLPGEGAIFRFTLAKAEEDKGD